MFQASGTNVSALASAMEAAHQFAMTKLGVSKTVVSAGGGDSKPAAVPAKGAPAAVSGKAKGAGAATVSAPAGSAGSLMVQVAAKYAGKTVAAQPAQTFNFKEYLSK